MDTIINISGPTLQHINYIANRSVCQAYKQVIPTDDSFTQRKIKGDRISKVLTLSNHHWDSVNDGAGFGADPLSKQHCREHVLGLAWCGTGEQHQVGRPPRLVRQSGGASSSIQQEGRAALEQAAGVLPLDLFLSCRSESCVRGKLGSGKLACDWLVHLWPSSICRNAAQSFPLLFTLCSLACVN